MKRQTLAVSGSEAYRKTTRKAEFLRNLLATLFLVSLFVSTAESSVIKIGVVLMHGKGGAPTKNVSELASSLAAQGYLVANLEMPWSGGRDYDVGVSEADTEVEDALKDLRQKGAQKLFIIGHSMGGVYAFSFGARHPVDGIVAIAPGGDVGAQLNRERFSESVDQARRLIAEGKGEVKTRLMDFEGSKGAYPVITTPSSYLTWFDPEGAMNQMMSIQKLNPAIPVLYISPTNDYPNLRKIKQQRFDALPKNLRTKLYEPSASHISAPSASTEEIVEWTKSVSINQQ